MEVETDKSYCIYYSTVLLAHNHKFKFKVSIYLPPYNRSPYEELPVRKKYLLQEFWKGVEEQIQHPSTSTTSTKNTKNITNTKNTTNTTNTTETTNTTNKTNIKSSTQKMAKSE